MKYVIAITGGKGGTGKTLVAVNLAIQIANNKQKVLLVDCDTENPNTNILLGKQLSGNQVEKTSIDIFAPFFDSNRCDQCGICKDACYRHAILFFPDSIPSLISHLCSGCETCQKLCPTNAIKRNLRQIGFQYFLKKVSINLDLLIGELKEGEPASVLIVKHIIKLIEKIDQDYDIVIIDTSPGAHCDVQYILDHAEKIIAVTEPTPFGQHDLFRIFELTKLIGKTLSIIINRSNITKYKFKLYNFSKEKNLEVLGEIPISKEIIEDYAKSFPFILDTRDFEAKTAFLNIFYRIFNTQIKN